MTPDFARIPRQRLPALLRAMPKAELHIHIEGSLEPELIFALAQRNGVALAYPSVEALRAAYAFTDLQSFLDIYYAGASVLLHRGATSTTWRWRTSRAPPPTTSCTPRCSSIRRRTPRAACRSATVIGGLRRARASARGASCGVTRALILCFLRHLSEDDAFATLEQALPYRDKFIGVGLDSQRARPSAGEVRARVRACRELGLHLRRACRRGRAAGLHRGARSTCCRSSASTTACAASRDPALVAAAGARAHRR